MTKKKANKNNIICRHHRRQRRLDTVFSYQDDIKLAMGIVQYGNKWKHIWKEKNLKHIPYSSLKDRARSKAFKELIDRIIIQQQRQQRQQQQRQQNIDSKITVQKETNERIYTKDDDNKEVKLIRKEKEPNIICGYPSKDILSDLSDEDDDDNDEPTYLDVQLRPPCQPEQATLSPTFRYWHQPIITKEDIRMENETYL